MFLVHNGKVIPKEKALVPIYDPALFADFRIYETMRSENGRIIFLEDHLNRLFNSAEVIGMELGHRKDEIRDWANQCVRVNETDLISRQEDFAVYRVIVHGDAEDNKESQIYIYPENFRQPTEKEREEGIYVVTFEGERIYPFAKTISRLTQFKAAKAFQGRGAFEAILVGKNNRVHEGTRSNVFLVRDNRLITPSLETVLPGIRRRYVIELAQEKKIPVEERRVNKEELYTADEAFITSTILELAAIGRIDDYRLPKERPIFEELQKAFHTLKKKSC